MKYRQDWNRRAKRTVDMGSTKVKLKFKPDGWRYCKQNKSERQTLDGSCKVGTGNSPESIRRGKREEGKSTYKNSVSST